MQVNIQRQCVDGCREPAWCPLWTHNRESLLDDNRQVFIRSGELWRTFRVLPQNILQEHTRNHVNREDQHRANEGSGFTVKGTSIQHTHTYIHTHTHTPFKSRAPHVPRRVILCSDRTGLKKQQVAGHKVCVCARVFVHVCLCTCVCDYQDQGWRWCTVLKQLACHHVVIHEAH